MKKKSILIIALVIISFLEVQKFNGDGKESTEIYSEISFEDSYYYEGEKEDIKADNSDLQNKIDEIIETYAGGYEQDISVYYYNFDTEEEYSYNGDKYYVAASTTKIPLDMSVLDDVYNGKYSLDANIEYMDEDYEEGTGVLWYEDYIGSLTVDDAIYLSIVYSDNIAKNMLKRIAITNNYDYISNTVGDTAGEEGENKYTARQLGDILKKLYYNEENNPYYNDIIEYMKETVFHERLDKYLPYEDVAHKIGSYYRYYHDMGIIYGNQNYALVIMTKDIGELEKGYYENEDERNLLDNGEAASELIANISRDIYYLS